MTTTIELLKTTIKQQCDSVGMPEDVVSLLTEGVDVAARTNMPMRDISRNVSAAMLLASVSHAAIIADLDRVREMTIWLTQIAVEYMHKFDEALAENNRLQTHIDQMGAMDEHR